MPSLKIPTLVEIEVALGEDALLWAGRCYEIACAVVQEGLVEGAPVYGHFVGEIDPRSYFGRHANAPFVRHGWVQLPDGRVLDPTRWSFESGAPYLYVGDADDYDEGGNVWREAMLKPPPAFVEGERQVGILMLLGPGAHAYVLDLFGVKFEDRTRNLTFSQAHWLANLPYNTLSVYAGDVYGALEKEGLRAHVPIDNYRRAQREKGAS